MRTILSLVLVLLCGTTMTMAQSEIFVGPQVSLLGPGVSGEVKFGTFSVSADIGWIPINSIAFESDDVDYLINTDFYGAVAMGNYYPGAGRFSIGVGALIGGYNADGSADDLRGDIDIGNGTYDAADIGMLTVDIKYGGFAPAVMLGVRSGGFNIGIGAAISGKPDYELGATGSIQNSQAFQDDLDFEAEEIFDGLDGIPVLPLLRIGWQFGVQ
ncbi:MAG: hypothetical protein HKN43_13230 [Rhodothermales bacterium]|nr:hypothetical protein [Rhodothermales bacterium]